MERTEPLASRLWQGAASPVVALHGLTGTHMQFVGIAERLAPRRGLFAPDFRGRGGSPATGPFGLEQHARDVIATLDAAKLQRSVLLGYSMGAFVAGVLVARHPERFSGLVLLDGGTALEAPAGQDARQFMQALLGPLVARLQQTYPSVDAYLEHWRGLKVFGPRQWGPWVEAWLRDDVTASAPVRTKASVEAVREDFAELLDADAVDGRLRRCRVPVLCIRSPAGTADDKPPLFPQGSVERIKRLVPGEVTELLVPGTNHYSLAMSEPGASAVADAVHAFALRCER